MPLLPHLALYPMHSPKMQHNNPVRILLPDTGTDVKVFYSCHNLTAQEFKDGETYLSMMEKNVETLKEVLNGWH